MVADPGLTRRLVRLAAASGLPAPHVVPGAAVLLIAIDLPVGTQKERRRALPFALEPHLATPIETNVLTLGPQTKAGGWICAAAGRETLRSLLPADPGPGPVVPDLMAVPLPSDPKAWGLWCTETAAYVRTADGGGLAVDLSDLKSLWAAFDRPDLHLFHGHPPPGVDIAAKVAAEADPAMAWIDLRSETGQTGRAPWVSVARTAAATVLATGLAHAGLLHLDANALAGLAAERSQLLQIRLADRVPGLDPSLAPGELATRLDRMAAMGTVADPFLTLLTDSATALAGTGAETVRDLRWDGPSGTLSVLLAADDLGALQRAETAVSASGLRVESGAATRIEGGAEMQIVIARTGP